MSLEFRGETIKIRDNFLVGYKSILYKTNVLHLNGYVITEYKINPLDWLKPIVKENGMEHLFAGTDEHDYPVYIVPITSELYAITLDFEKYRHNYRILKPEEVIERYTKFVGNRKKWFRIIDDHYVTMKRCLDDSGERIYKMYYTDGERIFKYVADNLDDALNAKLNQFEKILELPKEPKVVDYYIAHSSAVFYLSDGHRVAVEFEKNFSKVGTVIVPMDETATAIKNGVGMKLEDEILVLPKELREYYGPDYAYDGEHLYTIRGVIKTDKINDEILKILIWGNKLSYNFGYYIDCTSGGCRGEIRTQKTSPIRVLGKYYWYNPRTDDYTGNSSLRITTGQKKIEYKNGTITVNYFLPLPKRAIEKIINGETVKISEILPGFPENGEIVENTVKTGIKKYYLDFFPTSNGVVSTIPYVEGVYKIFIPYDIDFDPWTPESITKIPEDYIVEPIIEVGWFAGVEEITYDTKTFTLKFKDARITLNRRNISIEYRRKKVKLPASFIDLLRSVATIEKLWTMVSLV